MKNINIPLRYKPLEINPSGVMYDEKEENKNTKCECKVVKELDYGSIRFGIGDKVMVLYDTLGQPKEYTCEIIHIGRKSFVGKYMNENNKSTDIKFNTNNILLIKHIGK